MERKASKEDNTALSLSVRAQKKILGSVAGNSSLAKLFIDDRSAQLLDTLYRLTRDYTDNKRRAEKLLKYSIKSAIKFMVLLRKDQLNDEQLAHCAEFRRKMRHATVTLISFYEVEYSLDRTYLSGLLAECGDLMKKILEVCLVFLFNLPPVFHPRINQSINRSMQCWNGHKINCWVKNWFSPQRWLMRSMSATVFV